MFKNVYKDDEMKREQHEAVRKTVGWYYFTHYLIEVTGEDSVSFLDKIYVNNISSLKTGCARYTTALNDEGIIIDDVVIFRIEQQKFWISTLFKKRLTDWFDAHKEGLKVEYADVTPKWDMHSVQGPRSKDLLNVLLAKPIDDMKFFTIADNSFDGIPVKIARAGFAGEKIGYEIYSDPENTPVIAEKLSEAGTAFGAVHITEFQVLAWTLSTEKGLYLMADLKGTNPLEVGFERSIDWNKNFIGKAALAKIKEEGPKRQMFGFTVDEDDIHIPNSSIGNVPAEVFLDDQKVGIVKKVSYSYMINKNIGYALLDKGKVNIGDKVKMNGFEALVTEKVFY